MYHLAAQPEFIPILRAELESCLDKDINNWTKDSLETCWKLDSFLKESSRLQTLNGCMSNKTPLYSVTDFNIKYQ